jgi:hypothetical protein
MKKEYLILIIVLGLIFGIPLWMLLIIMLLWIAFEKE